jgi:CRP-like cAMP-binding protein
MRVYAGDDSRNEVPRLDIFIELKKIEIFKVCDDEMLMAISEYFKIRKFNKNTTIFNTYDENKFIYFVLRGNVSAIHQLDDYESGDYVISRMYSHLEGLNCGSVWDDDCSPEIFTAITGIDGATVAMVNKKYLLRFIEIYPIFSFEYAKHLRKAEKAYLNHVAHLLHDEKIELRLIRCLCGLSRKNGQDHIFPFGVHTHEKLARMIGSTRESVTREITKLISKGIIYTTEKGKILGINTRRI